MGLVDPTRCAKVSVLEVSIPATLTPQRCKPRRNPAGESRRCRRETLGTRSLGQIGWVVAVHQRSRGKHDGQGCAEDEFFLADRPPKSESGDPTPSGRLIQLNERRRDVAA